MKIVGRLIVIGLILYGLGAWFNYAAEHPSQPAVLPNYPGGSPSTTPVDPWTYSTTKDAMTSASSREARIASSNEFEFGFPYKGPQHAIVVVRTHPRYGRDVILQISRGQFMCGVSDCSVSVRFDDGKPQAWPATRSADSDSTVLFLRNHDAFVAKLAKAKVLRMEPTIYQQGNVLMEFPVAGFSPDKYRGK